jgi:Uncharacterised nucleotidyltransferase
MLGRESPSFARNRAVHEHALLALDEVLRRCRDAAIEVLPVKGVLTGRLWYADTGERFIQDIDLRVRARDLARVEAAGRRAGWRMLSRSGAYEIASFDVLGFLVEFEAHVGPPGLCGLAVQDMFARAVPATMPLGFPHLQPEIHDHALLLCVNAFKDKLVEAWPGGIRDLELLARQAAFDPQRLIALARQSGSVSILWIVAAWLARERGSTEWADVRSRLGDSPPRPVYTWLFERALRAAPRSHQVLRPLARVGADRPRQWARALYAMAGEGLVVARRNATRLRGNQPAVVVSGRGEPGPR